MDNAVSAQIAALAREVGTPRVAAFATAIRQTLLPVHEILRGEHPAVGLLLHEHEPADAVALLADDDINLALTYDDNLAPAIADPSLHVRSLGSARWSLGVPAVAGAAPGAGSALEVFDAWRDADWIVNSRDTADETVVCAVASLAGFRMFAALAALSPVGESSTTTQHSAGTPIDAAACRNRSGAGLPRETSWALKMRSVKRSMSPTWPRLLQILGCDPLEATQKGTSRASTASATPGTARSSTSNAFAYHDS